MIRTRCPCGWEQKTNAKKTVTCIRCGKRFTIRPKNDFARIARK